MNRQHTTDEIATPIGPFVPEEPAIRFVDIHIYDQEPEREDPPSVESHMEAEEAPHEERNQEDTEPAPSHQKRRTLFALCLTLVSVALVGLVVVVYVLPLVIPDATITIVPSTQQIRITTSITVTTGQATGIQLQGRALVALTMNQARTVPTTGTGRQDAKAGQGYITFYNAAPYPQTIAAGTMITGADGVQVVTEPAASIPAASYPTFGQVSVPTQAILPGPGGNIRAGDIYGPCCRLNVSAVNSAFQGGQQARDYPMVTPHDISTVVKSLQTSVSQSAQAALQTQVHPEETMITPLPCQQSVKADHSPGEEASQVTVTLSETCTGVTYPTQAFQSLMTQRLVQDAHTHLGDGYAMQAAVQASITQVSRHGNEIVLQVSGAALWGYVFPQQQQAQIKQQVAGKSKAQAITILLHTPGVQTVSFEGASIPTDVSRIHLVLIAMQ